MKDSDWEIICELYKLPNITKVAANLYITQPALTKRLKAIENEFQIKIVDRTPKGVKFTDEGTLLAKKAEKYMHFLAETKKEMRMYRENKSGTIQLGSSYSYQKEFLNDILPKYMLEHPHVNFETRNEPSHTLFRKVCDKDLDCAFVQGDYTGPVKQIVVQVYKAYVLTKDKIDLRKLPTMPMISYRSNDKTTEMLETWWNYNFNTQPESAMSVVHIDFVWELIAKNMGFALCFLPSNFNYPGITLTPMLKPDGTPIERNSCFVYTDAANKSIPLQEFIDFVKENMSI